MKRKNRSIMENKSFTYNYSAVKNKEVESIRRKYMPHKESKLETLKRLDYPIYRRIARKTKAELTPEILRLSEEIRKS